MPKAKETSNHPCHFLSLPSAKRFWCRHCMSVFEDAITRWRHSRTCRYGTVDNFMRRRQLEAKALQNTTRHNPIQARLEQSVSPSAEPITSGSQEVPGPSSDDAVPVEKSNQGTSNDLFRCFICHNKFATLEQMRHHVKYPCNNKKIATDVPSPAMTVYIDEFTDRSRQWEPQPQQEEVVTSQLISNFVAQETMNKTTEAAQDAVENVNSSVEENAGPSNITPTNIYVNEQGETVIEVENLDLNSEGGELSLAHLLTQLSQQGIVFDKTKASQMEIHDESTTSDNETEEVYTVETTYNHSTRNQTLIKEEDDGQSTAEDAANTLAQLAVFRGYRSQEAQNTTGDEVKREYIVDNEGDETYTYTTANYTIAPSSTFDGLNIPNNNMMPKPEFNVQYEYKYIPRDQQSGANTAISKISLPPTIINQTPVQLEVPKPQINSINQSISGMPLQGQGQIQPRMITYIPQPTSSGQQNQIASGEPMLIENFLVQDPAQTQASTQQFHSNMTPAGTLPHAHTTLHSQNISSVLHDNQNSFIVISAPHNSSRLLCNQQNNNQLTPTTIVDSNIKTPVPTSLLGQEIVITNHNQLEQQTRVMEQNAPQQAYIQVSNEIKEVVAEDMTADSAEEFQVETVTLQEIAENEVSFSPSEMNATLEPHINIEAMNKEKILVTNNSNSVSDFIQTVESEPQGRSVIEIPQQVVINSDGDTVVRNDGQFTVSVRNESYEQSSAVMSDGSSSGTNEQQCTSVEGSHPHQLIPQVTGTTSDFTITVVANQSGDQEAGSVAIGDQESSAYPVYQVTIQEQDQSSELPSSHTIELPSNNQHCSG